MSLIILLLLRTTLASVSDYLNERFENVQSYKITSKAMRLFVAQSCNADCIHARADLLLFLSSLSNI